MESNRGPEEEQPKETHPVEQPPKEQRTIEPEPTEPQRMSETRGTTPEPERHNNWLVVLGGIVLILLGGLFALAGLGSDFTVLIVGLAILAIGAVLLFQALRTPTPTEPS